MKEGNKQIKSRSKKIFIFFYFVLSFIVVLFFLNWMMFGGRISFTYEYLRAYENDDFPYKDCSYDNVCTVNKGDYFVHIAFSKKKEGDVFSVVQAGCFYFGDYINQEISNNSIILTSKKVKKAIKNSSHVGMNGNAEIITYELLKADRVGESKLIYEVGGCIDYKKVETLIIVE